MPSNAKEFESPETLVSILVAAVRSGDRNLERHAKQRLEDRFGVTVRVARDILRQQDGVTP